MNKIKVEIEFTPVSEGLPGKQYIDIGDECLVILGEPYNRVAPMAFVHDDFWSSEIHKWTKHVIAWAPMPDIKIEEIEPK